MPNFLSKLNKAEQARLLEELNYINLDEIRGFCVPRGIPYKVVAEYPNGKTRVTLVAAVFILFIGPGVSFSLAAAR